MKRKLFFLLVCLGCLFGCSDDDTIQSNTLNAPDEIDLSSGITPCINGFAGPHSCNGYDLLTLIPREDLLGPFVANEFAYVWGWTDPETQKEYALIGSTQGVYFVDVTDPISPVYVGKIHSFSALPHHRQVIRTHGNFAFIVGSTIDYGMKVFDLTRLRDVDISQGPILFTENTTYNSIGNASRITINEDSNYAYVLGSSTFDGGPHFIDISNPSLPTQAGGFLDNGYTQSAQVVSYRGPDLDYINREILVSCNDGSVAIVDVTNKSNPTNISSFDYVNAGYPIQGQFTQDMRYYILGDFWDEIGFGNNTRTIVLDFSDLDDPKVLTYYFGPTRASDFGGEIDGNTLYLSNLSAGVRMIDLSSVGNSVLTEVGHFDTYPNNDDPIGYIGATNVYPYFSSGSILVNDIYGIFIIRKSN